MAELICTCGAEPAINIDMRSGPGCMCHIKCECGAIGNTIWDVKIPWADLVDDWNDETERELRRAMKMGFATRDDRGRYSITELGKSAIGIDSENPKTK